LSRIQEVTKDSVNEGEGERNPILKERERRRGVGGVGIGCIHVMDGSVDILVKGRRIFKDSGRNGQYVRREQSKVNISQTTIDPFESN
jgi:hypothetical protein